MKRGKPPARRSLPQQIKRHATRRILPEKETPGKLIPTGCVLFDLALSDSIVGGWKTGKIVNVIGDSSSGKSILALSTLAEVANSSRFRGYRLIFDDVECASEFNVRRLFGRRAAKKIAPPRTDDDGEPLYSNMIEDFHSNIRDVINDGKPFIYVLDSFDALHAEDDEQKADRMLTARKRGEKTAGTYALAKPKMASWILRDIKSKLANKAGSLLIIISQTRANIDPFSPAKKTRSGGMALRFYSTHEVWLAIKKKIKSRNQVIGVQTIAKISKNKLTGKIREVEFPIYYDYGIDNIGACIDWLVREKYWKKRKNSIVATLEGDELVGSRNSVIKWIEREKEKRSLLNHVIETAWNEREESLKLNRKPKYV